MSVLMPARKHRPGPQTQANKTPDTSMQANQLHVAIFDPLLCFFLRNVTLGSQSLAKKSNKILSNGQSWVLTNATLVSQAF